MAKLRIYHGSIQALSAPDQKLRLYHGAVQVLWVDEVYWGCDFIAWTQITADLTTYPAALTVFPFAPFLGITETLEWRTDVLRASDGSEQRISVRPVPRQGFRVEVYLKDEQEQARLSALLFQGQKGLWGVAVWAENTVHEDTVSASDTSIYFDTSDADYRDGSFALLWQGADSYELLSIESVESDQIVLAGAVAATWTDRKWIMPLRLAYMRPATEQTSRADGYAHFDCSFVVRDNALLTGYVPDVAYKGLPVLTVASLEDGGLETQVDGDVRLTDYGLGKFTMFSDSDFNIYVQGHVFRNKGKAACWKFRQFLHSLYGKRGAVWIPTFKNDLVLREPVDPADTTLMVESIGWGTYMEQNALRTHLAFVFPDGTFIFREMTDIEATTDTAGNPETIVTMDSALGVSVDIGECEICFLDKCRLTEDKVEIEWDEPFRNYCRPNFTRIVE